MSSCLRSQFSIAVTLQVASQTLEILRTPMPLGSPVPYPAPDAKPGKAQLPAVATTGKWPSADVGSAPGISNLHYTVPFELRCDNDPWQNLPDYGCMPSVFV
jgi:hypothetical protein